MKNWDKLYEDIMACLKKKLPPQLKYHHWEHTEYVIKMSEFIAKKEDCTPYEILLIKTAALFHDSGFVNDVSIGHELASIQFAQKRLPKYGFTIAEIEQIVEMIAATEITKLPKNKLESILVDADLEYLGTENFHYIGNGLYQELKFYNPSLTIEEWDTIQIDFLQKHKYFTSFCLQNRAAVKEKNLQELIAKKS
jgi:uncharacterized protein